MATYEILIADDHPLFRSALHQALTLGLGPDVRLVEVASIAELEVRLTEKSDWDLVLLDLNMPKKDGREALKEIRNDERFKDLNVAIFSTSISEQDKVYTSTLGVTQHITKPFDFSELVHTIKEVCDSCLITA